MSWILTSLGRAGTGRSGSAQTVRRSRAPVSEDGWRNFDIARASI
jgi:hypothetical protein